MAPLMGFLALDGQVVSGFVGHRSAIGARRQPHVLAEGSLGECRRRICNHGCVVSAAISTQERSVRTREALLKWPLE